jgi:predicted AlkP superfamily phosphohydrolase/phosphomutase
LNAQGIRVGLVNVPLTYPVSPLDGFVICGFGAPQLPAELTHPVELLSEIEAELGEYTPVLSPDCVRDFQTARNYQELYDAEVWLQAVQVQAALHAAHRYGVEVLATNLMLFDHTNHRAPDWEQVESSLREMDLQLGLLLEGFQPDDVMLLSDHGGRRFKGLFLLGDWLSERGYLVRRRRHSQTSGELNFFLRQYLESGWGLLGPSEKYVRAVLRKTIPRLPAAVADGFWRDARNRAPQAYRGYWLDPVAVDDDVSLVLRALNAGTIYLRHDASSTQSEAMLVQATRSLVEDLHSLHDPETSQPLFRRVLEKSEAYGPNPVGKPPDIVVDHHGSQYGLRTAMGTGLNLRYPHFAYLADNPQVSITWYGDHEHEGVYVFSGSSFQDGAASGPGHVVDIPSTLLHLYSVPIPDDFDGRVLASAFIEDCPILSQPGDAVPLRDSQHDKYGELEEAQVLSHLRALGYVD